MSAIELSLSESFHKHKRNLVILCSAITVLSLASPDKLKPPFVGTEVDLPASLAFLLLGVALLYMFFQYYIEFDTMRARHSSEVAGRSKVTVDDVIENHLASMAGWVTSLKQDQVDKNVIGMMNALKGAELEIIYEDYLKSLKKKIQNELNEHRRLVQSINIVDTELQAQEMMNVLRESFDRAIDTSTNSIISALKGIEDKLSELVPQEEKLIAHLAEYSRTYLIVGKSFRKLSLRIGRAQRIGFKLFDGYLVWAFSFISLCACVGGVIGWEIKLPAALAPTKTNKFISHKPEKTQVKQNTRD